MMINIQELTQEQINAGLLKVKEAIRKEPEHFDMRTFVSKIIKRGNGSIHLSQNIENLHFCDSVMCITGHLTHQMSDNKETFEDIRDLADTLANSINANYNSLWRLAYPNKTWDKSVDQACDAIDQYIAGNYDNPWLFDKKE